MGKGGRPLLRLENISKYYHNEGLVTQGLHKINLEFQIGEFVAITGESGSGKSTLLNVISGVDTYEDGEYYINGEETSYYDESDWEKFRRDTVGFIFQNYNLIDSYTVLKNVEIAMLIQGVDRKTRRKRALEIIEKVGLTSHLRHRASKLSGGQKQRLAIARALAKDTPMIVADEPTGNLDSESGKQILKLLADVAKERLVIVVTHNYEAIAPYVTRKIRLFDGEVAEDKVILKTEEINPVAKKSFEMNPFDKVASVSLFNLRGQPKKTIFILLVAFVTMAFLFLEYGFILMSSGSYEIGGGYSVLNDYPERVVVARRDKALLTDSDYQYFSTHSAVSSIIKKDAIVDVNVMPTGSSKPIDGRYELFFPQGFIAFEQPKTGEVIGSFPDATDEVLISLYVYPDDLERYQAAIGTTLDFQFLDHNNPFLMDKEMKISGIHISESYTPAYYFAEPFLDELNLFLKSDKVSLIAKKTDEYGTFSATMSAMLALDTGLSGTNVRISGWYDNNNKENYDFFIGDTEIHPEFVNETGENKGVITLTIGPELMEILHLDQEYQMTVNLKNPDAAESFIRNCFNEGYNAFSPYRENFLGNSIEAIPKALEETFTALGMILNTLFAFLISYLILKSTMNSKIRDYAILRTLGIEQKEVKNIIRFEVAFCYLSSYILLLIGTFILRIFNTEVNTFFSRFTFGTYFLIALLDLFLAYLISRKVIGQMQRQTLLLNTKAV